MVLSGFASCPESQLCVRPVRDIVGHGILSQVLHHKEWFLFMQR
jgi:hypothetical protein